MPMSAEAARYRREAEKCRAWAAKAHHPEEKTKLEDLARQYDELAALAEQVKPATAKTGDVGDVWAAPRRRRKRRPAK